MKPLVLRRARATRTSATCCGAQQDASTVPSQTPVQRLKTSAPEPTFWSECRWSKVPPLSLGYFILFMLRYVFFLFFFMWTVQSGGVGGGISTVDTTYEKVQPVFTSQLKWEKNTTYIGCLLRNHPISRHAKLTFTAKLLATTERWEAVHHVGEVARGV